MIAPEKAALVEGLVETIGEILHGHDPDMQGTVLADLTAIWLCGFQGPGKHVVRRSLLKAHMKMVQALIPLNEKAMMERMETRGRA